MPRLPPAVEIDQLTPEERLALIERLWDSARHLQMKQVTFRREARADALDA
jgi:putative addiction module component (TIGR02574 family)